MAKKTLRKVLIGGLAGHMVSAVYQYLVGHWRETAIEDALVYQHRASDIMEAPFMGVYESASTPDHVVASKVGFQAAFPETSMHFWAVERVEIISDDNPGENPGERRVVGLVVMRHPDTGPFRPMHDQVARFKVVLNIYYAENKNTPAFDAEVCAFETLNAEDLQLAQVAS